LGNNSIYNILKKKKYQGINLAKVMNDFYKENCKELQKEIQKDFRRWEDLPLS
jgi:hypothetical protein